MHGSEWNAQGDANRSLLYAIVASILIHAFILLAAPGVFDPARRKPEISPAPMVARLALPHPVPAPPILEPAASPQPEPAPRKAQTPSPVPRPQLSPREAPAIVAVPAHVVPPSVPAAEPPRASETTAPTPPAAVPQARQEASPPSQPAAPTAGDAADPQTLGQYRIAIIATAKRYKRYPRLAIDNNWEGQAEIRMVIGADGSIVSIALKSCSGYEVLDQQALEMIRKAKPLTPIPASLRGRGFTIDVPVVFSLKEETG